MEGCSMYHKLQLNEKYRVSQVGQKKWLGVN